MTIADAIYSLSAATSLAAAFLLWRQYRMTRTRLLLWSGIGFAGLAINNVLVLLDLGVLPDISLALPRAIVGAASMLVLVYGLVRETGR